MCRCLKIPRSSYYYKATEPVSEAELEAKVKQIFRESKSRYGARKIKKRLEVQGMTVSRRRIRRIMKRLTLVSVYQQSSLSHILKGEDEASLPKISLARRIQPRKATGSDCNRLNLCPCRQELGLCFIDD